MKKEANGPADCLVTKMLQCLPSETVYEVTHWFNKRFQWECWVPEAWIRLQRCSGDRRVALQGRRVTITVDKVLRARGKMLRNKSNGPADCLVTEVLQCFPDGDCLRRYALIRQAFQRRAPCLGGVETATLRVLQTRRQAWEGPPVGFVRSHC